MAPKKKLWHLDDRSRRSTRALLSGVEELFYPTAKNAHEIVEVQGQRAVDIGNEGDPMKITIKLPPKKTCA